MRYMSIGNYLDMGFSDRISLIRDLFGLSQTEMGGKFGVSQNTYCNYEKGNREPDIKKLNIVSQLGISVDWLITGEIDISACKGIRNAIIENSEKTNEGIAARLNIPYKLLMAFVNNEVSPSVDLYEKIRSELNIIDIKSFENIEKTPLREVTRRIGELEFQLQEWQKRFFEQLKENTELKAKMAFLESSDKETP